jgi:hypothetical protein
MFGEELVFTNFNNEVSSYIREFYSIIVDWAPSLGTMEGFRTVK